MNSIADACEAGCTYCAILLRTSIQEALGQLLTHLSETATADKQMFCNIFPILSLQLMKGSPFEQVLVVKKKYVFCLLSLFYHMGMIVNGA